MSDWALALVAGRPLTHLFIQQTFLMLVAQPRRYKDEKQP